MKEPQEISRWKFFASLFGFGMLAKAQRLADPQNQWNNRIWRRGGKALNGQCPVCGTVAQSFTVNGYDPEFDDCPPGRSCQAEAKRKLIWCRRCNNAFFQLSQDLIK